MASIYTELFGLQSYLLNGIRSSSKRVVPVQAFFSRRLYWIWKYTIMNLSSSIASGSTGLQRYTSRFLRM
ncbi:hypothetical protein LWM68_41560 [Niabella sp. W65]|nr:hypothetical protein [Niabella sp. W65]MCH7368655.1 hypothetical protein [Niabella sp. W65]ULT46198.1 hypothetical protein KRR40_13260 [Niabella sp. I65]